MAVGASVLRGQGSRLPVLGAVCLHDADERVADRQRREQALSLARAINSAEAQVVSRTGRYQPLAQLGPLPTVPEGLDRRLYTDGDGYIYSIKDSRDPCRFGIFSDQYGTLYPLSPTRPLIAS